MAPQTEWSVDGKGAPKGRRGRFPPPNRPDPRGASTGANVNRRQDSGRVAVELRGVTGTSGCGKTTRLNIIIIGGFAESDAGR
jgi:hypothetical protein